jgi:hypothetical protein
VRVVISNWDAERVETKRIPYVAGEVVVMVTVCCCLLCFTHCVVECWSATRCRVVCAAHRHIEAGVILKPIQINNSIDRMAPHSGTTRPTQASASARWLSERSCESLVPGCCCRFPLSYSGRHAACGLFGCVRTAAALTPRAPSPLTIAHAPPLARSQLHRAVGRVPRGRGRADPREGFPRADADADGAAALVVRPEARVGQARRRRQAGGADVHGRPGLGHHATRQGPGHDPLGGGLQRRRRDAQPVRQPLHRGRAAVGRAQGQVARLPQPQLARRGPREYQ